MADSYNGSTSVFDTDSDGSEPSSAAKWHLGQVVKTLPFHGSNTGSNPVGVTIKNKTIKGDKIMNNNNLAIMNLEYRIHLLSMRDPVGNQRIINKLKRKLRSLQN